METQQLLEVKRTSEAPRCSKAFLLRSKAKWRPKIWSLLATWVFGLAFLTMALVPSHCGQTVVASAFHRDFSVLKGLNKKTLRKSIV